MLKLSKINKKHVYNEILHSIFFKRNFHSRLPEAESRASLVLY